ncbi:phosphoribosyltransferase family protein [Marinoscillum furvescens]|uniref:Pyrimidine operon attenuation protein/uracil phosphoribosyltransferase n=1 Tax=Marinoscillum furvescens DSM 4134 TaxID=1122208 RepID=A0A3D9L6B2_MARFU|nr:phosphoribosyltransferase family protein [Marinoscillum furvescens]RED99541.1 pyrimidine operon attenuation protein/uracil phosphoribosyltransferase [Marinoscillum furvescens DSM 4134]
MNEQKLILEASQVTQIIRRIAFEIYENNFEESEIVVVGIYDKGYFLAEKLQAELTKIVDGVTISLVRLEIDKSDPAASDVKLGQPVDFLAGKTVVLVDDVLNTGKTLVHSMKALLDVDLKKLQTAVLVNRSHKQYPVLANYMGYELSTTLDEHVEVKMEDSPEVYLY